MKKQKIILDVDTGTDDAVAIMAAALSADIDLIAVCSVAGNKPIENTTENSLRVLQALGSDVPVYKGCAKPLVKYLAQNRIPDAGGPNAMINGKRIDIHPEYLDLPKANHSFLPLPAAAFYVDYLRKAEEPVTLVAVGPLTNLATAFIMDSSIIQKIEKIVIMGGGFSRANHTPYAEFNIWADPEAAQWVINADTRIVMVPLDATQKTALTMDDAKKIRDIHTFAAEFTADLVEHRILVENALQPQNPPGKTAVHDALALLAAVDESLLTDLRHVHCDIGFGDFGEGATLINASARFYVNEDQKNIYFAYNADKERYLKALMECFNKG